MESYRKDVVKLLLIAATLLFAPILVPMIVVTLVTVLSVAGGILALCIMFAAPFLPFLFGIFAVPLFFSAFVTAFVYVCFKIAQRSLKEIEKRVKPFVQCNKLLNALSSMSFIKAIYDIYPGTNSASEIQDLDKKDSWGDIPSFEAEMKQESKHVTIPYDWHFPFPRASLGCQLADDYDQEDFENLIKKIEELHEIVCYLRTPSSMRRYSLRKTL